MADLSHELHVAERRLLKELRDHRRGLRKQEEVEGKLTFGQQCADLIAAGMGSWRFIIIQSVILVFWIIANILAWKYKWDPYPFILLNLALSFQAAYAAPIIMMSQNRQSDIDRKKAENDYNVNIKAELEIELLHQKVDELREKQLEALTQAVADLTEHVKNERQLADAAAATAAAKAAPKAMAAATAKPAATPAKPTAKPATAARASRKKA